ncbi:RNA polymerase sigma factor SigZ [Candidatus Margulisiibacteriota bacterium]
MKSNTQSMWEEFSQKLLRFVRSKVKNKEDAEDILQSVFLKIHEQKRNIKAIKNVEGWLYQITRNAIIDYYRKHKKTIPLPEDFNDVLPKKTDNNNQYQELTRCLKPMINSLPPQYKEPLLLADIKEMKQKEIAKKLKISISGAKSRVQRARKMLKEQFLKCCTFNVDTYGNIIEYHPKNDSCKKC